jgi:hypothetical protein
MRPRKNVATAPGIYLSCLTCPYIGHRADWAGKQSL